ncbi:hypothetical protein M405DRAFT_815473 [Rhizopogon salebrosus TDB-379]|nr:hypothetical protein M405DRAFT_815473 [Rhizopogon salebrosus TDB-379]
MRPPFLEVTVPKYQLLWQFYVKDGQPLRAAEILAAIAESDADLPLYKHLEYLTLAVANAKSHLEKLDVAQVQLEVYHASYLI